MSRGSTGMIAFCFDRRHHPCVWDFLHKMREPSDIPSPLHPGWMLALILFATGATLMTVITKGYHLFSETSYEPLIQGVDDASYYLWLKRLVVDGDLDFNSGFRESPLLDQEGKDVMLGYNKTGLGKLPNKFTIGWAILSLPPYFAAHLLGKAGLWTADGYGPPYQLSILLWHLCLTATSLILSHRLALRWVDRRFAWIAVLGVWLCSPLLYYQTARISMAHGSVFFLCAVLVWLAFRVLDRVRELDQADRTVLCATFCIGLLAGLLIIVRPPAIVYLALPFFMMVQALRHHTLKWSVRFKMLTLASTGLAMGLLPQALAWKHLYGKWLVYSYEGEGFNWLQPDFYTSLWSSHHGFFNWHPLLLPCLITLLWVTFRKRFPTSWVLSAAAIIYINAAWHLPAFGSAFGGRAFDFLVFFAMIGGGFLLQFCENKRILSPALAILVIAAFSNVCFLALYISPFIPREDPVPWLHRFQALEMAIRSLF